jgi:hypothetical protein
MQEERQTREEERTEDDESQKSSLLSGSQKDIPSKFVLKGLSSEI